MQYSNSGVYRLIMNATIVLQSYLYATLICIYIPEWSYVGLTLLGYVSTQLSVRFSN